MSKKIQSLKMFVLLASSAILVFSFTKSKANTFSFQCDASTSNLCIIPGQPPLTGQVHPTLEDFE